MLICGARDSTDYPTLEQLRFTLLVALIGFNQSYTYDECMVASTHLTRGGVKLKYTDRVGYRDIINSTDSFVRDKVGEPLLQAMVAMSKQFIANFEEYQAALNPPLPHPGPLVAMVQGHDWTRISRNGVERCGAISEVTDSFIPVGVIAKSTGIYPMTICHRGRCLDFFKGTILYD